MSSAPALIESGHSITIVTHLGVPTVLLIEWLDKLDHSIRLIKHSHNSLKILASLDKLGNDSSDLFNFSIAACDPMVSLTLISFNLREELNPTKAVAFAGSLFTALSNDLMADTINPNVFAHSPQVIHAVAAVSNEVVLTAVGAVVVVAVDADLAITGDIGILVLKILFS